MLLHKSGRHREVCSCLPAWRPPHARLHMRSAGARWDAEEGCLADSRPNELHPAMPVVWVRPVTTEEYTKAMQAAELYQCPVYTNMQVRGRGRMGGGTGRGHGGCRLPAASLHLPTTAC